MDTVLIEVVHVGRRVPEVLSLGPGETVTFGRAAPGLPVDIPLTGDGVSRLAGEVTAAEDYWLLTNLSRDKTYVVENLEGAGEYVKVAPRRVGAPVPFEFARVVLPTGGGFTGFKVTAPQHAYADEAAAATPRQRAFAAGASGERTASAFPLDVTAKYFLVLVALCEPRLRDSSTVALPTVAEVVERLRPLESCRRLTRTAVNYHIDYLASVKLRVKEGHAERLEWKREALVSLALRFNLVREEHLAALPRRRPPALAGG